MSKTTINIASVLAPIVGSRDVASGFKALISKAKTRVVDLDFEGVEFISRSAAHEILTLKDKLAHGLFRKKAISIVNTSENVAVTMLRVAAASRAVPRPKYRAYKNERTDINLLYNFPQSP